MPPSPDVFAQAVEDVRNSPGLRRRLEVARAWAVRPSELLEWSDEDLALALALLDVEADSCPGCGMPQSVVMAPEAEQRFAPGPPIRCHYCTARSQSAKAHETDYHPHARFYTVRDRALEPDPTTDQTGATGGTDDDQEAAPAEAGQP